MVSPVKPHSRGPRFYSFLQGLLALCLALLAQYELYANNVWTAALLFGVALFLFVLPLRAQFTAALPVAPRPGIGSSGRGRFLWRLLPALLALGASAWSLRLFLADIEQPSKLAWGIHIGSLFLIVLFGFLLDRRAPNAEKPAMPLWEENAPWSWRQMGLFGLIMLLALFLRLWQFAELPFGTWYDEAEAGLATLRILQSENYWPIYSGSINAPAHYLYLIAFFFHYVDVSTQSIRLVSVVMGVGMVGAAYLVGRELMGRLWGLAFAFLMAVARWGVNFSRIGMYNISTPLFELLTIGFLLRAFRRGRYLDYVLAGLALGFGLCFYVAFQLFVVMVLLFGVLASLLQRGFLRRTWSGFLLMLVTATLVVMPAATFAYSKPDLYFSRAKGTSLFADKTPLTELPPLLQRYCPQLPPDWAERCQQLPRLWENARKHLLMFNYQGDPNGRHNLPGEPMLDNIMAALLVLGVGICLLRFWRVRALLLLLWLGIMLLAGILSLGFEAPQSLRAIGTLPAAYLLALVPLYALQRAWIRSGGRADSPIFVVPLCGLLLWSGYANFYTYFYRQATDFASWNAFSTPETIAANLLTDLDEQTDAYVISYFTGHPTINFLAQGIRPPQRIETTDHLPLPWAMDRNVALIVNADSRSIFDEAKRYYPAAHFEEIGSPAGGPPVVYYAYLSRDDLLGVQGLQARYYGNDTWSAAPVLERKELTINTDWATTAPVPLPFSAEWDGVLNIKTYGAYQFSLQAPAYAELYIGEQQVMSGTGAVQAGVVLAEGKHTLRLRAVGGAGALTFSWRPPDGSPEVVPATALYVPPVTSNGLLGHYYANGDWQGTPVLERIDPTLNLYFHIPSLPRPYTVEWRGKIAIPQSGTYRFGLEAIDEAMLTINDQAIVSTTIPNQYKEGAIDLTDGLHDVVIRYADRTDHTHINFYWVPPFSGQQPVPSSVLFPPQANYERVALPDVTELVLNPNLSNLQAAPSSSGAPLSGVVRPVAAGLNQPKGIAVGLDNRLYVADTGNKRVLILQPDGTTVGELRGPEPFSEPFDLAVGPDGQIYVLDAAAERIQIFATDDSYLGDLPAEPALVGRARGIHVDQQGRIWVAHTPGAQVIALDSSGQVLMTIPVWPGEDSQPVDVVVGLDGSIFVTDAGLHKLVRFDADGRRLLAWDIPVANSIDSSHLAVDGAGNLYLSKPEPFLISQLQPSGEPLGDWLAMPAGAPAAKPIGIAVDSSGRVWYVDTVGGMVYVIEPEVG